MAHQEEHTDPRKGFIQRRSPRHRERDCSADSAASARPECSNSGVGETWWYKPGLPKVAASHSPDAPRLRKKSCRPRSGSSHLAGWPQTGSVHGVWVWVSWLVVFGYGCLKHYFCAATVPQSRPSRALISCTFTHVIRLFFFLPSLSFFLLLFTLFRGPFNRSSSSRRK